MKSIPLAMTWEYWRRGAAPLVVTGASMAAVPAIVYGAFWFQEGGVLLPDVDNIMQKTLILVAALHAVWGPLMASGKLDKKQPLPATSWAIVGWPLAWGALTSSAMYLVLAAGVNFFIEPDWPLWAPALLFAAAYAVSQAISWSLRGSPALIAMAVAAEGGLLGLWSATRPGASEGETWAIPTFAETIVLLATIALAYVAAVFAFQHQRRGGRIDLAFLQRACQELIERWTSANETVERTFASPSRALLWREWREKGARVPLAFAVMFAAVSAIFATGIVPVEDALELLAPMTMVFLLSLPLVGVLLGHASPSMAMPTFKAAQPVTDSALAGAVLKNVALTLLASLAVWIVGCTMAVASLMIVHGLEPIDWLQRRLTTFAADRPALPIVVFAGVLVQAWTLAANGAWLGVGRKALLNGVLVAVSVVAIGAVTFIQTLVSPAARPQVAAVLWAIIAGWTALGAAAAFLLAIKRRLVMIRTCAIAFVVWAAICAMPCIVIFWKKPYIVPSPMAVPILLGFAVLIVAPIAATPLALAANRRR